MDYFAEIISCIDKYTTVLSFDKNASHHICLSAASYDFLHQEILAFRCIGRLLGARLVKRHRHVEVLLDGGGDFSPSLSLKESGDRTGEYYNWVGKGCVENKSFSLRSCYVCDDQPAILPVV